MAEGEVQIAKGEATPAQIKEIEAGDYFTIKQVAIRLGYSTTWITFLVQNGRIKAMKPLGGQWRIPKSEYQRLTTEGIPPLPRERKKAPVEEIIVDEEKAKKVAPPPKSEQKKGRGLGGPFDWLFK